MRTFSDTHLVSRKDRIHTLPHFIVDLVPSQHYGTSGIYFNRIWQRVKGLRASASCEWKQEGVLQDVCTHQERSFCAGKSSYRIPDYIRMQQWIESIISMACLKGKRLTFSLRRYKVITDHSHHGSRLLGLSRWTVFSNMPAKSPACSKGIRRDRAPIELVLASQLTHD